MADTDSTYPILVEQYDARHPALAYVCEDCGADFEGHDDPEEADCERCGGFFVRKYTLGQACRGCGTLAPIGERDPVLKGCCSRACMLQAEYAAELAHARGT